MKKRPPCIVLCGFMGCGKSTVGRTLARILSCDFLDLDAWIEKQEGRTIPELFATEGEAAFREMESAALRLQCLRGNLVLASGGGTLLRPENATAAHDAGARVVFLDCPFPVCYRRIQHSDRPIVRRSTPEELEVLYTARLPAYTAACDELISAKDTPEIVAKAIVDALQL